MAALCLRISTGMLEPFANPFCAAHFPLAAALLVVVAESLRCACWHSASAKLVHGNESVLAEKSPSGRGTGPSAEAGVQGLLLHGSWRAPKLTVTNAPVFGHAAFWRGAVAETRF